ncbi:unnamed protein product [Owenia fusiformis]|uniref:Uncharacterized protein n=1 Tax=Owenia fusiformis TaxID=6347 RepID=A0A8J1Y2H3_OWEFU|nr:unnamed protein product [Owenia fusiformis]
MAESKSDILEAGRKCSKCRGLIRHHIGPHGTKCDFEIQKEYRDQDVEVDVTNEILELKNLMERMMISNETFKQDVKTEMESMKHEILQIKSRSNDSNDIPSTFSVPSMSPKKVVPSAPAKPSIPVMTETKVSTEADESDTSMILDYPVPQKTIKAVKSGKFVNMIDLLPANLVNDYNENPDPIILTLDNGHLRQQHKRKVKTITSFNQWLSAWSIYECILIEQNPILYSSLIAYRTLIQEADKKFHWNAINLYDIKFRTKLAQSPSPKFDKMDITLYVTTLDATCVKNTIRCHRCSGDHKVSNCPFQASSTMAQTSSSDTKQKADKDEVCNNYQFGNCKYGTNCYRMHKCNGCGTLNVPRSKCTKCPSLNTH